MQPPGPLNAMPVRLSNLSLSVLLMGLGALAMYVPALYAASERDWDSGRAYLHSGTIFLALTAMIALATANRTPDGSARPQLLALLGAFTALPLMLAVPLWESVGNTSFVNAWFEMVSSLTTTGATVFDDPTRLSGADHLWRAQVGWMGGFLFWVAAVAILAPLSLGGFEVLGQARDDSAAGLSQIARVADAPMRLRRYAAQLAPIYAGLTAILWIGLMVLGDTPLVAISHAMSTLATSGISPAGGTAEAPSGIRGEVLIFIFFFFALSRRTFDRDLFESKPRNLLHDPELQMGLFIAILLPVLLFARHWVGAIEVDTARSPGEALQALWGGVFTVLSFLSTTGFESGAWESARNWSGLATPGLILMGLAIFGGGVATTAGGVKLLRVYVLYRHAQRELERLVHPSSMGGAGGTARYLRRQGAVIAWIFFMIFALSIGAVMLALSLTGSDFETALVLTISALSTTGPLAVVAGETPISFASLSDAAKLVLAGTMVLGRLEALAIIALLNPEFWRN